MSSRQHDVVRPYYMENIDQDDLKEIQEYISQLKESDFHHREIIHKDDHHSEDTDVYRTCEIHYPLNFFSSFNSLLGDSADFPENVLFRVGKKIFKSINERYYKYDLSDVYEFQLIKYYVGGNYNWHCDYGLSANNNVVRKLSMSIQLTEHDKYEGGELQVVDWSNRTMTIDRNLGLSVVFDSRLPHKVWPLTWGERIALVGWANGPQLR